MELNAIELTVTDGDLRSMIDKYVPGDDLPVSDLEARVGDDGVVVSGKYRASILKGSFEAIVSLRAEGQVVLATLTKLKALGPVGAMFKGVLMSALQKKLADIPGICGQDDAIKFDLAVLLARRGVAVTLSTLEIRCAPGALAVKLSGSCAV